MSDLAFCRSTGRSTKTEVGRSDRSIDVHKRAQPRLASGPVDRAVDRPESSALWIWPRSTDQRALLSGSGPGRPRGRLIGQSLGSVDRAVDRKQTFLLNLTHRLVFGMSYKCPSLWAVFIMVFKSKNSYLS